VTVWKRERDGDLKHIYYERTFQHRDTREIRLFGLGGEDVFDVKGDVRKSVKVRIIGGGKKAFAVAVNCKNLFSSLISLALAMRPDSTLMGSRAASRKSPSTSTVWRLTVDC